MLIREERGVSIAPYDTLLLLTWPIISMFLLHVCRACSNLELIWLRGTHLDPAANYVHSIKTLPSSTTPTYTAPIELPSTLDPLSPRTPRRAPPHKSIEMASGYGLQGGLSPLEFPGSPEP